MTKFNWTPDQIGEIPFPVVQGIIRYMIEEQKRIERERRLAERRAKRGR